MALWARLGPGIKLYFIHDPLRINSSHNKIRIEEQSKKSVEST